MKTVGTPYWLSRPEVRAVKAAGSFVIAFKTEQEAAQAIRNPLFIFGLSLKAERLLLTPSSRQCRKCYKFGHIEARCRNSPACSLYGEHHTTAQHTCSACPVKGRLCTYTTRNCVNCKGAYTANSIDCDVYIAAHAPRVPRTDPYSMDTRASS